MQIEATLGGVGNGGQLAVIGTDQLQQRGLLPGLLLAGYRPIVSAPVTRLFAEGYAQGIVVQHQGL